jgi:hypothetical protein
MDLLRSHLFNVIQTIQFATHASVNILGRMEKKCDK